MLDIYNDISFFYLMGNHQIYPYFVKTINNHEILYLIFIILIYINLYIINIYHAYQHIYLYFIIY